MSDHPFLLLISIILITLAVLISNTAKVDRILTRWLSRRK